jgi:DNA-directed RNA polymerase I and III subunit RPAC2
LNRYMIVKNSDVKFCGYSMPHPSENICLMQIQMCSGLNAIDALERGFRDLMDSCQHIKQLFNKEFEQFSKNNT